MSNDEDRLPDGYMLDDYRIDGVLGQGGFGITYLAHTVTLDVPVAVKEYMPAGLARRGSDLGLTIRSAAAAKFFDYGYESFQSEAKVLMSFRDPVNAPNGHPNVVNVVDTFKALETVFMVMPYLDGEPLGKRLADGDRPYAGASLRALIGELLDGLEAVHARGLVHRDIKPDNIFLTKTSRPILIDFGAARFAVTQKQRALTAIVSDGYSPQEQYDSSMGDQGPWTDFYALGATLYHVISGAPPPPAPTLSDGADLPPLTGVDADIGDAVTYCLAQHPEDRPQTAAALRAILKGEAAARVKTKTLLGRRRDDQVNMVWDALRAEDGRYASALRNFKAAFPNAQEVPAFDLLSRVDRYGTQDIDDTEELVDRPWRAFIDGTPPEGPAGKFVIALATLTSPDLAESAAYSISDPTVGAELESALEKMLEAIQLVRADEVDQAVKRLRLAEKELQRAMSYGRDAAAGRRRQKLLSKCLERCQTALTVLS